jgi:hypothetical protein
VGRCTYSEQLETQGVPKPNLFDTYSAVPHQHMRERNCMIASYGSASCRGLSEYLLPICFRQDA